METARFIVEGRVQGVGFRYYATQKARALGVRGWVRNCQDGTVEAAVCGPEAALSRLEQALWSGPGRVGQVTRQAWPMSPSSLDALTGFAVLPEE